MFCFDIKNLYQQLSTVFDQPLFPILFDDRENFRRVPAVNVAVVCRTDRDKIFWSVVPVIAIEMMNGHNFGFAAYDTFFLMVGKTR